MAKTIFTAQKENLTDYQDLEKIKYVLNGETKYYTKEELTEYHKNLLKNSQIYFEDTFEQELNKLIENLKKYDGDPYGYIPNGDFYELNHKIETLGKLYVHSLPVKL